MHERSLMVSLMAQIEAIARVHQAQRVIRVDVTLGPLAHISPAHFREHFQEASQGTICEGAELVIQEATDPTDPHAQEILLTSIEIEEIEPA